MSTPAANPQQFILAAERGGTTRQGEVATLSRPATNPPSSGRPSRKPTPTLPDVLVDTLPRRSSTQHSTGNNFNTFPRRVSVEVRNNEAFEDDDDDGGYERLDPKKFTKTKPPLTPIPSRALLLKNRLLKMLPEPNLWRHPQHHPSRDRSITETEVSPSEHFQRVLHASSGSTSSSSNANTLLRNDPMHQSGVGDQQMLFKEEMMELHHHHNAHTLGGGTGTAGRLSSRPLSTGSSSVGGMTTNNGSTAGSGAGQPLMGSTHHLANGAGAGGSASERDADSIRTRQQR